MKKIILLILALPILIITRPSLSQNKNSYLSIESAYLELLKDTNITLSSAMKIAIDTTNGKVVDAKLKPGTEDNQPIYKIGLLKDNQFLSVRIDGKSGKVLSVDKPPTVPKPPIFYKKLEDNS